MSGSHELVSKAREVYERNRVQVRGLQFHQPALGNYESIYAWDSGWCMIAAAAFDPEVGIRELEALFSFQFEDGRVPHESRLAELGGSETLARRLYIWWVRSQFDEQGRSRMIDPPSYLIGAARLYRKTKDRRILALLPRMQLCLDYLTQRRDIFGDGLVAIIHPWECGCDMAPYFDEVVGANVSRLGWQLRYERFYHRLMQRLGRHDWNPDEVARRREFAFEDVGFNGIAAAGALALAELWRAAGDLVQADSCSAVARRIIEACEEHLWDEERGFFYPRWNGRGWNFPQPRKSLRSCLNGVAPLISGLVSPQKAARVLDEYVASAGHFATPWGISFNSLAEEDLHRFEGQLLWRGPCMWMSMNWLAAEAASVSGHLELAAEITGRSARLIEKSGFREYYDPHTGAGGGARDFTWPGLIVDMLERHGLPQQG